MLDLSKEEAAALLCEYEIKPRCYKCFLFNKVADIADCWEHRVQAYRKLKAYIEQP